MLACEVSRSEQSPATHRKSAGRQIASIKKAKLAHALSNFNGRFPFPQSIRSRCDIDVCYNIVAAVLRGHFIRLSAVVHGNAKASALSKLIMQICPLPITRSTFARQARQKCVAHCAHLMLVE
jgi:hypothetical protein